MLKRYRFAVALVLAVLLIRSSCWAQIPTNNPISEFYNGAEGYPAWIDEINWANAYNMATYDYSGCSTCANNDFEKFKYVRDIAYNAGGGVLYYPAGTYIFDIPDSPNGEGLMLKKGVVIRGEKPAAHGKAVTKYDINTMSVTDHGLNSLPTKFKFTTTNLNGKLQGQIAKMWNAVGIKKGSNESGLHKVSHIGICYVEIEYGYIYFGFEASRWANTWGEAALQWTNSIEPWRSGRNPDGTHPMDHFAGNKTWDSGDSMMLGEKRLVFGNHIKHGGVPNYVLAHGLPIDSFYCEDSPYHFGAKISVYGSYVFVANNVISKPTISFPFVLTCRNGNLPNRPVHTITVPYDFGKGLSIDINKNYVAGFINRSQVDNPNSQYAPNVILRDNWIYNHSNKSVDIGGSWMVVKNNIARREYYTTNDVYNSGVTPPIWGTFTSNGRCRTNVSADDYLARAFTVSPRNAWADSNMIAGLGTVFDNSGEAIMVQDHLNGSECFSFAITNNRVANRSNIPGKTGWMGVWNSHAIGLFLGYNFVASGIMFEDKNNYGADVSIVKHTNPETGEVIGPFGDNIRVNVRDQRNFDCPNEPTPGIPTVAVADSADYVHISWTNVANEAGYRVQRRRVGDASWTTLAYRPRQETGGNVTFGFGPRIDGFIGINEGYPPAPFNGQTWDGMVRNMNPPVWRDYTKMAGLFEYRVVAIGCEDNNVSSSDSIPVVVSTKKQVALAKTGQLLIYPNPAREVLNINSDGTLITQYQLTDATGKVVQTWEGQGILSHKIDLKLLKPGIYLIKARGDGKQYLSRFAVN